MKWETKTHHQTREIVKNWRRNSDRIRCSVWGVLYLHRKLLSCQKSRNFWSLKVSPVELEYNMCVLLSWQSGNWFSLSLRFPSIPSLIASQLSLRQKIVRENQVKRMTLTNETCHTHIHCKWWLRHQIKGCNIITITSHEFRPSLSLIPILCLSNRRESLCVHCVLCAKETRERDVRGDSCFTHMYMFSLSLFGFTGNQGKEERREKSGACDDNVDTFVTKETYWWR